jgi:1,2-diacylglycerol 3-alpha-glucosyltransferase
VRTCAPWQDVSSPSVYHQAVLYLPGFCQIEQLPAFYASADCFVHPALQEPWGLVINEAMACRLPILSASSVGAADELVHDGVNGWRFDPADVGSLAEALLRIMVLPAHERLAMGEASSRLVEERCPAVRFGDGLSQLVDPP